MDYNSVSVGCSAQISKTISIRLLVVAICLVTSPVQPAAADERASSDRTESQGKVDLRWRFAAGDAILYLQDEQIEKEEISALGTRKTSTHRSFLYLWDVVLQADSSAAIHVGFKRVQYLTQTPEAIVATDTYRPVGSRDVVAAEQQQQLEVYRMLHSGFVFFAEPDGGTVIDDAMTHLESEPAELGMQTITDAPSRFTPGDSVVFLGRPIHVGEAWTAPVGLPGMSGTAQYRLVRRETRRGRDCWRIEGLTELAPSDPDFKSSGIARLSVGPRTSTHYFDAESGLLVEGEESAPIRIEFTDGRVTDTKVRTTRRLLDSAVQPPKIEVSRRLSNGENRKFWYRGGYPVSTTSDWVDVLHAGVTLEAVDEANDSMLAEQFRWVIGLQSKISHLESVSVYDDTFDSSTLVLHNVVDQADRADSGLLVLFSDEIAINDRRAAWLFEDVITERIFRIVLTNANGEVRTLHQVVLIPTVQLRNTSRLE